jgi:hypothetical protein
MKKLKIMSNWRKNPNAVKDLVPAIKREIWENF